MAKYLRKLYKTLKKLGVAGYSRKKNFFGMNPLFVSTFFIILTLTLANLARKLIKAVLGENLARTLVLEFLATAELCACCFELIIVADNFGVTSYAIYLFLLTVWWSKCWEEASACPYSHLEEVAEGTKPLTKALVTILAQVLGGFAIYGYVQTLWSLELAETHKGRAYEDCTADLQVPMLIGAFVEGVATFLCRMVSKILGELSPKYSNFIDAFFGTTMVVAAFNLSGGYFNPALATSLKLGCEGNTFVEHFVVYWIGATLGAIASVFLMKTEAVQIQINRRKVKSD